MANILTLFSCLLVGNLIANAIWYKVKHHTKQTCNNVDKYANAGFFICSNCGFGEDGIELIPNYCPNCGAKVVK